ncbi:MAG: helix-turn-helix domain-containing protein [Desulfovibrionaceae bacterium]|nr:helix-turn-helix domain-containing protein [Desulfovibrionaceae bacterium]
MQAFLNKKQAAQYCGYNVDTFSGFVRKYPLPKYGPKRNRYKCTDLDKWMEDPEQYRVATHRAKPAGRILSTAEQKQLVFGYSLSSMFMQ